MAFPSRSITLSTGRTTFRLEPEFWEALRDIAQRQSRTRDAVADQAIAEHPGNRTSAIRVFCLEYFRRFAPPVRARGV